MPAILVFVVFLVVLAFSVPIAVAMIAGSLAPIWITGVGGNVTQLVTNAFSGANSTPIFGSTFVHLWRHYYGRRWHFSETV